VRRWGTKQLTLAAVGFERYAKTTRRAAFLAEMERVVPWSALCALIAPFYPQPGNGRPDGGLAVPLAGDVQEAGQTVDQLRTELESRLRRFVPEATVSVGIKLAAGNRIYVIGKVNRPGQFPFSKPLDVMQALSLAGGMTPYAAANDIRILQRDATGVKAIPFHYNDVEKGRELAQDIILKSGDTVVVP
jgi:polysaccharide export outer membrane protein